MWTGRVKTKTNFYFLRRPSHTYCDCQVSCYMVNGDLRPIALTPVLSKVLEDFFVEWLIDDVKHHIDPQQSGSLKGTFTTY